MLSKLHKEEKGFVGSLVLVVMWGFVLFVLFPMFDEILSHFGIDVFSIMDMFNPLSPHFMDFRGFFIMLVASLFIAAIITWFIMSLTKGARGGRRRYD